MPRLSGILDQVMHPTPNHPPPPADNGAPVQLEPTGNSADGAPVQPAPTGNTGGEEPNPEQTLLALQYAETSLDYHNLEGAARDNVRRFAKLNELHQQIELYTAIETLKARCTSSTAAHDFVRSQTFLTHVVNCLKILLLAPHTMHYVRGLQEYVLDHMHDHPAAWKIPQEIIDNNDQWEIFAALVRVRLTSLRSQFKDKLFKAYEEGLDINRILFKLAPKQAVLSDVHRARWAWIVLSIDDFKEACGEGEYESSDFWTYLEDQLASTKKAIASNPEFKTADMQLDKFAEVFVCALTEHHHLYPTRVTCGRIGERPAWQETLEEAMGMGKGIYTVSAYA